MYMKKNGVRHYLRQGCLGFDLYEVGYMKGKLIELLTKTRREQTKFYSQGEE